MPKNFEAPEVSDYFLGDYWHFLQRICMNEYLVIGELSLSNKEEITALFSWALPRICTNVYQYKIGPKGRFPLGGIY